MKLVQKQIRRWPRSAVVILDGSPRRLSEAHALLHMLKKREQRHVAAAILVHITKKECILRLSKRRVCRDCHRSFTVGVDLRPRSTKCPVCHGAIVRRDDDTPSGIVKRLAIYNHDTVPVVRYFQKHKLLIRVNGAQPIRNVQRDIRIALKNRLHL
jgi:adenylate kinase